MRKILGGAVLALGVGGLGIYANNNHAQRMQTRVTSEASVVAMSSIHGVKTTVSGRDIRVTGYANDTTEHDNLIAALDALEGRRVVIDDLLVLEQASPFVFQSTKSADGQTYAGLVPTETVRAAFGEELKGAEAALELKAGVPDDRWDDVVLQALSSMAWLKEGEMSLTDRALVVTGKAATPPEKKSADDLLAELPEGYTADVNITSILPLAEPFVLSSSKSPDGQTYGGVVQNDDGRGILAAVIGDNADALVHSFGAPDGAWEGVGAKGLAALAILEQGEMNLTDKVLTVTGLASIPPIKADAEAMLADLPEGYTAVVDIKSMLDTASPFEIGSIKTASHQAYAGVIPSAEARKDLAPVMGADAAGRLKLAYGAPDGNWVGVAGQGLAALDVLEDGKMSLVDRVLTIEGRGATPIEKAKAESLVAELPEGYTANTDISAILQISSPYTLRSIKSGSMQSYSGDIPSEEDRAALATHTTKGVDSLVTSAGVPDEAWTGVAGKSLDALANLEEGKLEITDRAVVLTGVALTPVERDAALAALGDLPNGYTLNADISMLDDGSPAAYTITYDPIKGASVDGKLPKGMSNEAIASALGLRAVSGTPMIGRIGNTDAAVGLSKRLNVMSEWLPNFESFSLTSDGTSTSVVSKVAAGVDDGQVQSAIADAIGDTASITVTGSKETVAQGTIRETILGEKQMFSGGFWLPVQEHFVANAANCTKESDDALASSKINFVTGSAQLDAKSVRTVNSVAAIMLQCTDGTGLNVEVGGHTDSSGSHAFNVKLSQERAQSVVDALIERGVPAEAIAAKGFGSDVPIASNDTEEGKAANRRTTFRWYTPVVAAPFTMESVKTANNQTYSGFAPSEDARVTLASTLNGARGELVIAKGAPDASWTGVAAKGVSALAPLDEGKMTLIDRALTITGVAQTPAEKDAAVAMVAGLPDGYSVNTDITMLDDGSPVAYAIHYHPVTGASVEGKLPKGMSMKAVAASLGLRAVTGTPIFGRIGNTDAADTLSSRLTVMASWLPDFESFSLTSDGTSTTVVSKVAAGIDNEQVQTAIDQAMGDGVDVTVTGTKIAIEAGTVRETILGEKQVFSGGFWLPVQEQIKASAESCAAESDKILAASKVSFLTASAKLDAKSVRTVNSIAAVMLQCLDGTGLHVEVGGHTDSAGSHAYNVKLSKARAGSVMKELIARGVSTDLISAKGFGPDMPIASNDTEEGKAANRRTTIRWYMPVEDAAETTSTGSGDTPTTQVSE